MPDGFLILDKPLGPTAFDVVARVRRLVGERRVGHAGTLDPLATGVLPLALGTATRVIEYLSAADKAYTATVHLGASTTTYDREGAIIAGAPEQIPQQAALEVALNRFRGPQTQLPPMYSAVKQGGKRLYELARAGQEVERQPRPITIYQLDLVSYDPPLAVLDVVCSKGTYIRSLAHDLGAALGCGAHLAALVRTRHGPFTLADAVSLETLAEEVSGGTWAARILPPDTAARHLPMFTVDGDEARRITQGQGLQRPAPAPDEPPTARAYGPGGHFLALLAWRDDKGYWQPHKVFAGQEA